MQVMDFVKALESAKDAAREARKVLLHYFGHLSKVREKGAEGLVSEADVESEKTIKKMLARSFPEIPMLGEESAFQTGKWNVPDTSWIVDPLDGTTNYIHQMNIFCISIGLKYQGELVAGVVDVPLLNQTYTAVKGGGAFCNDQPIRVSERKLLKDSLLATGFFPHLELEEQIRIFTELVREARGVRRAGAAAYDLCLVAQGVFDGFWEKSLKPWDAAAGTLLIREAGGRVLNYQGNEYDVSDNSLLAANPYLISELQKRML
jgi:myo-inositol-1(or 4)-monophosphatase